MGAAAQGPGGGWGAAGRAVVAAGGGRPLVQCAGGLGGWEGGQRACQVFGRCSWSSQQDCRGARQARRLVGGRQSVGGSGGVGEGVVGQAQGCGSHSLGQEPAPRGLSPARAQGPGHFLPLSQHPPPPLQLADPVLVREQERAAEILRDKVVAERGPLGPCPHGAR